MDKIYIVGNPNSGKTTLFNSITQSSEHVGNWHGVTVDSVSKIIKFRTLNNKKNKKDTRNNKNFNLENESIDNCYEIVDLPGVYSLNPFSLEENISVDTIKSTECENILYLIDANNFKRSMMLVLELLMLGKNVKILINNYKYFASHSGSIDTNYLQKILGCQVEIIDARKIKLKQEFFNFTTRKTSFITTLKNEIDITNTLIEKNEDSDIGIKSIDSAVENKFESSNQNFNKLNNFENKNNLNIKNKQKFTKIKTIYKYILKIADNCVKKENKIYGYNNFDKHLLKLGIFLPLFLLIVFGVIYFTFFLIGPIISNVFLSGLYYTIQKPIMAILRMATSSQFLISLFGEGIFGACFSVLGFLPQICLMYLFLSTLENSGLISRMAYLFDDALNRVGLNGKIVYTMLMGFGCSTSATLTAKNMPDKNAQIKASLLTPFMSCSAKLPIYITVAFAILGVHSVWLIFGLYVLGVSVAILMAIIFERTILPSKHAQLILEFPPLKVPDLHSVWFATKTSCKQFVVKVFGVIFGMSVILWLLNNINIQFQYVGDSGKSILYSFSLIISWIFKPIGLNNSNIVCALLIGLVAKELILSSFAISNKVANLSALGASLVMSSSAVNFSLASGISFLVFTLLYFPCVSNFGVLAKEIGFKYTLLGVALQLGLAYMMAYLVYTLLTKGVIYALVALLVAIIIILSVNIVYKKSKAKKIFCSCINCNRCGK